MDIDNYGPIISRGETTKDKVRRVIVIMLALLFLVFYSLYVLISTSDTNSYEVEEVSEWIEEDEEIQKLEEELESLIIENQDQSQEEDVEVEEDSNSPNFYLERALEKEKNKDYEGAFNDYTKSISLSNKYSKEKWEALNNRGIISAKQFKKYKSALEDFNLIIETEVNRTDGNMNLTRLESGYSNRAYVKKMLGNKEGACDDLYLALGVSSAKSAPFIEKQIEKNCY